MIRLAGHGRVDTSVRLNFTFEGQQLSGHPGDTLASALLANGIAQVATSIAQGRPRGVMSAGVDEASALVQLETPYPEPMLTATTVELFDGLVARGLPGRGELAAHADPARYDAMHLHCELLVVGAGPAGLSAALDAARTGIRVVLVDDQPEAGGCLLDEVSVPAWVAAAVAELTALPQVTVLQRTSAFGYYDDGFVLALQKRTDHLGLAAPLSASRQRVWRIRAEDVLLATGAHERPVVFADNDRPGIMLAHAARAYLNRYGVLVGRQIVVYTTNDSTLPVVADLTAAGATVTVIDARDDRHVIGSTASDRVTGAVVADSAGLVSTVPCDALLVSGGWNPTVHLYSQARGKLEFSALIGAFVPADSVPHVRVAGAAAGSVPGSAETDRPALVLWVAPGAQAAAVDTRFVDLQRDATVASILRAAGAGMQSVEHVKRYTTIGTAHDQGKTSGLIAAGILADALGTEVAGLGTTTYRPPYTSVSFAALAGRDRGAIFDPVRVTAIHPWHVAHGAEFEDVGQWKRPWYYPQPGEDLAAAVDRETRAARTGVAMMDGSTLGKISVQGADAGEFLDRMYTNLMSTLKPGFVRYGVMCGMDGMMIDDGTALRVSPTEFLVTTTTGNAAMIMDWLEEFAQTEWPDLDVWLTSVTEHWVTIPLVGPRSRQVLAAVAPELDVSNEAFGFMTWRDTVLAGVAARVARISFSGELAYEVNVPAWSGVAVWQALYDAGQPYGITPYGTETMHVLRAEKGFPIIGQDTDGTVTPPDLGMSWVVSKKKPDFVGKRSFARADNQRPDRKQLVGLLPVDSGVPLAEGAQLLAAPADTAMLGHVTSAYSSAALGRTFGLALLKAGRDRIGETVYAWHDGVVTPAVVTSPVLYDAEGARRDG